MTYHFKKAVREQTSVLVALAGPSGSGKTFSAIRFAKGLTAGRIAVIDTEAGRALHYADTFDFDHVEIKPPFSPESYTAAIEAAEAAGYEAIIVDSMSHEWAGEGGCQDLHDEAVERMSGGDARKAERVNVGAWREPKMAHKRMISRLLQCRSHLIFCLRAEEKIKMQKDQAGKMQIVPVGFQPICEKNFMYEMTVSFLMLAEHPGIPQPIKLQEQHKPFFDLSKPLDEESGKRLAAWAGGKAKSNGKATGPTATLIDITEYVARHDIAPVAVTNEVRKLGAEKAKDLSPEQLATLLGKLKSMVEPSEVTNG